MNKKLMAVAIAGALTAPGFAAAQVGSSPGITLYGRLDSMVVQNAFKEVTNPTTGAVTIGKVTKGDVYTAGNEMGVRGRESIGGGTSVWFQLATGVWPDARLEGATTTGNNWGGRNSALGVSSSLGDILWGIWDTPYKQVLNSGNVINSGPFGPAGVILGNGDSTGALPNNACGGAVSNGSGAITTGRVCVTEVTTNNSSFEKRISNSVQYWSPTMAGVRFKLATAMYNYKGPETSLLANGDVQNTSFLGANVTYAHGPLSVGVGFESHKAFRASNSATGKTDPTDTGFLVGGKWNFGPGQVGVAFEQLDYKDNTNSTTNPNGMKVATTSITGRWNVGPGAIWAGYTSTPGGKSCGDGTGTTTLTVIGSAACGSAGKANEVVLGYDYVMSKRSKLYFAYGKFDNGTGTNYYYIAGPAANSQAFGGGLAAGTDVTTFAVGMQHTF
jgi:predicted porin